MGDRLLRSRALGLVFLGTVAVFAGLGLRGRFDEVGEALGRTSPLGLVAALVLVVLGLHATAQVWLTVMDRLGAPAPRVGGTAVFFVGQLGKYLPGSVWAIGAQAGLARRFGIRTRSTVTAGLVFLGYNVATAGVVAAATGLVGVLGTGLPRWALALLLLGSLVSLTPAVVNTLGGRVAGGPMRVSWPDTLAVSALLALTWTAYAAALVALSPERPWRDLLALGGAFAASYAVGVVVVLAPAGLGAREATFVLLLTPVTGVGPATALALLARVVHTAADTSLAAGWWLAARDGAGQSRAPSDVRQTGLGELPRLDSNQQPSG